MAFTAMIGKELLLLDHDADAPGRMILSTYVPSSIADIASETAATDEESSMDGPLEDEKEGLEDMKSSRPEIVAMLEENDDRRSESKYSPKPTLNQKATILQEETSKNKNGNEDRFGAQVTILEPRRRFTDSLSALQIEEAKATGRAQLGLAFEMLTMMKKRALGADPEAYQCLIDACGRVGDTKRATDLLAKMHEDGIVADGTVYACLVSAFSAESAWKKGTKEEDLPGEYCRKYNWCIVCGVF